MDVLPFVIVMTSVGFDMNVQVPFFKKDLEDQTMKAGSMLEYVLPESVCEGECDIKLKVKRGDAKSFSSFINKIRAIQFVPNED